MSGKFSSLPREARKIAESLEIKLPVIRRRLPTNLFNLFFLETSFNVDKNQYEIFVPRGTLNNFARELKNDLWAYALCRLALSEQSGFAFTDSLREIVCAEIFFPLRHLIGIWTSDIMKEKEKDRATRMFSAFAKHMPETYVETINKEENKYFSSLSFLFFMIMADRVAGKNKVATQNALDLIFEHGFSAENKRKENITKITRLSEFVFGLEKLPPGYVFAYYQLEKSARAVFSILGGSYYPSLDFEIGNSGKNYKWTFSNVE